MGNGVSFALFSRPKKVLELYVVVTCNTCVDNRHNHSTELWNLSLNLRSILVNKDGECLDCMVEYYQAFGANLNEETKAKWVDNQIQCIPSNVQINFSEFQSFYLTYATADETKTFEMVVSSLSDLDAVCKSHLNRFLNSNESNSNKFSI